MLIDIASVTPPYKVAQSTAAEELKKRMGNRAAVSRMIDAAAHYSGIDSRFIVMPDADPNAENKFYSINGEYVSPGTQRRMNEYEHWSKNLAANAVGDLFKKNNVDPKSIGRLITISCTGFFAPGLDYHLIQEFQIRHNVKRTNIGFMGCAASLIGFNSILEAMNSADGNSSNALLVSVELCSLHLQTEPTRDNILANMIFADGCAAALFSNDDSNSLKPKFKLLNTSSYLFDNSSAFMGWKIGNFGFEMTLSPELPKIILESAVPALESILKAANVSVNQIKHWALHPGGRAILDALQKGLTLTDEQMQPSRKVLRNFGNMSSTSILFVLKEIIDSQIVKPDEYCCAVAFGPGLTMETALLKGV
jgi:predicted naringenin-chalcone synthase